MVDQVIVVGGGLRPRVTNAVAMGQGEPFANYDATLGALRLMNSPDGSGIGARHLTVSTCGLLRRHTPLRRRARAVHARGLAALGSPGDPRRADARRQGHAADDRCATRSSTMPRDRTPAVARIRARRGVNDTDERTRRSGRVLPRHAGAREPDPGEPCRGHRLRASRRTRVRELRVRARRAPASSVGAVRTRRRHRRRVRTAPPAERQKRHWILAAHGQIGSRDRAQRVEGRAVAACVRVERFQMRQLVACADAPPSNAGQRATAPRASRSNS